MRLVAIIALVIGLSLAGTAVYFASERFRSMEARLANQRTTPGIELVQVAIATRELRFGDRLTREAVRLVAWPKDAQPATAFTDLEGLFGPEGSDEFRSIRRVIEPNEPILVSKVTEIGEPAGIAQRLRPGMRAFTIRVDVATGVSGFLSVGDAVDVLWTGNDRGRQITKTIAENVELIAIDQQAEEQRGRVQVARTVTVEGTRRQVHLLTQASNTGRLTLTLRGFGDDLVSDDAMEVDITDITGEQPVVAPVPEPEQPTVIIRRGTQAAEEAIPSQ